MIFNGHGQHVYIKGGHFGEQQNHSSDPLPD